MAVLDGGGVTPTPETGEPIPTPEPTDPDLVVAYGVTVQRVRELASHIGFDPAFEDPDFGPTKQQITDEQIRHWITLVADSVTSRTTALRRYSAETDRWAGITGSARTAVTNGAASYLVAAAYPARAGNNEQTAYSAELWRRYEAELQYLQELPGIFAEEDAAGAGPAGSSGRIRASRRPAYVADDSTLFQRPGPYPVTDPNRYTAPGAEGTYGAPYPYRRW